MKYQKNQKEKKSNQNQENNSKSCDANFLLNNQTKESKIKPMKTTRKEVKSAVRNYIFEIIDETYFGIEERELYTNEEYLILTAEEFKRVSNHINNLRRYPNTEDRFKDYLNGMPSNFGVECYYHEMIKILESWGLPQPENKTDQDSADLYFKLITREFFQMLGKTGYDIHKY